jgi:hypothetical protein
VAGKVTGPGSGSPVSGPIGGSDESPSRADGPRFTDKLEHTEAAARASNSAAATPPRSLTAELGADLRAGKITPKAAVDRVIDRVVEKQLGVNAPAATREKLRAALEDAVADDPLLADKIRGLG